MLKRAVLHDSIQVQRVSLGSSHWPLNDVSNDSKRSTDMHGIFLSFYKAGNLAPCLWEYSVLNSEEWFSLRSSTCINFVTMGRPRPPF